MKVFETAKRKFVFEWTPSPWYLTSDSEEGGRSWAKDFISLATLRMPEMEMFQVVLWRFRLSIIKKPESWQTTR